MRTGEFLEVYLYFTKNKAPWQAAFSVFGCGGSSGKTFDECRRLFYTVKKHRKDE